MRECDDCGVCVDDEASRCPVDGGKLHSPFPGSLLIDGKYRLERRLGRGGMGAVYQAYHLGIAKPVALKLILSHHRYQGEYVERFRREARILGQLDHPNVVAVMDFGFDREKSDLPYLVMELLSGQSLADRLIHGEEMSVPSALALLREVAAALDSAHNCGVFHRDLKPANIFLTNPDPNGNVQAKVVDFGIAATHENSAASDRVFGDSTETPVPVAPGKSPQAGKEVGSPAPDSLETGLETLVHDSVTVADRRPSNHGLSSAPRQDLTRPATVIGTPGYLSPELIQGGPATRQSDIYAFGVVAYETLCGRRPFDDQTGDVLDQHLTASPQSPSAVRDMLPAEIDDPVLSLLSKQAEQRPASASAAVVRLDAAWELAQARLWHSREGPKRWLWAELTVVVAAAIAWLLGQTPVAQGLEMSTVDARFAAAKPHPFDPRLLIISIDDGALQADASPLAQQDVRIAAAIQSVFDAGAKAVAIDLLLPDAWGSSEAFSRLLVARADHLALAAFSTPEGKLVGTGLVHGLATVALGTDRAAALFGYVDLKPDDDGKIRRMRTHFTDSSGRLWSSFAGRAAALIDGSTPLGKSDLPRWIDFSSDWRHIPRISLAELKNALADRRGLFANRLIILGAEYSGSGDIHKIPASGGPRQEISGTRLQALMIDTLLGTRMVRSASTLAWLPGWTLLLIPLAGRMLTRPRLRPVFISGLIALVGYLALSFATFLYGYVLLPMATPALALLSTLGLSRLLRRQLCPVPESAP